MPREYRNIKEYESEIFALREQGKTNREICEKFGLKQRQLENFINRHNRNQAKLSSGISIKPKGRPRKDGTTLPPSIQQLNKVAQLQYELARKERLKIVDVLNFYTNGKTPPKITDVSFIGDVSRQGILPDLVKYFIETNR